MEIIDLHRNGLTIHQITNNNICWFILESLHLTEFYQSQIMEKIEISTKEIEGI